MFQKEIDTPPGSRKAEIQVSQLSITLECMDICIVSEKLEQDVFHFFLPKLPSRSPGSMFLSCDTFRVQLRGNISHAFRRDRSFPSPSVFKSHISIVRSLTWATRGSGKETLHLQKCWTGFIRLRGLLDIRINQRDLFSTARGQNGQLSGRASNTVSTSPYMQHSQDCRDWTETERLDACYTTYGSVLFFQKWLGKT